MLLKRDRLFLVVVNLLGVDLVGTVSATWFRLEKDRLGLEKDFFVGLWAGE